MVETRNRDHTRNIFSALCKRYDKIRLINGKFISADSFDSEWDLVVEDLFARPLTADKEQYVEVINEAGKKHA